MIDGVVITLTDITEHKEAEQKLNQLNSALHDALNTSKNILDTVPVPLLVLSTDLSIISANRSFYKNFYLLPEDVINKFIYNLPGWNIAELKEFLSQDFPDNNLFEGFEIEAFLQKNINKKAILTVRKISNNDSNSDVLLLALELR